MMSYFVCISIKVFNISFQLLNQNITFRSEEKNFQNRRSSYYKNRVWCTLSLVIRGVTKFNKRENERQHLVLHTNMNL